MCGGGGTERLRGFKVPLAAPTPNKTGPPEMSEFSTPNTARKVPRKPALAAGDIVMVNCGTGPGIRGHLTNPFTGTVVKAGTETCTVTRSIGMKRPIVVPTWACIKTKAAGDMFVAPPDFRALSPSVKTKIMRTANKHAIHKARKAAAEIKKQKAEHDQLMKEAERRRSMLKATHSSKMLAAKSTIVDLKVNIAAIAEITGTKLKRRLCRERKEKKEAMEECKLAKDATKKEKERAQEALQECNKLVQEKQKLTRRQSDDKKMKLNYKAKLKEKNQMLKDQAESTKNLLMDARLVLRTEQRGQPYSYDMERHARALMSTGTSAEAARQQFMMDAAFFLSEDQFERLEFPDARWFSRQREGTGIESWLHAHLKLAKCERVLQFGFDETEIALQSTMNQWVWIETSGELELVTLEAGGILCGSTSEECVYHFRKTWERGQEAVKILREALGNGEVADRLAPLVGGGGEFHKMEMTMHDTVRAPPPPPEKDFTSLSPPFSLPPPPK